MEIRYSKRFGKQLDYLRQQERRRFAKRVLLWLQDPGNPILRTHALKGKYEGFYSMNIGGDLRALYKVVDDQVVLFELIGTHAQLYG